jgi:hypothetical protein
VPAAEKLWFVVAPLPDPSAPKVHAHEATPPSASLEPVPSNEQARYVQLYLKLATGGWFGGGAPAAQ